MRRCLYQSNIFLAALYLRPEKVTAIGWRRRVERRAAAVRSALTTIARSDARPASMILDIFSQQFET
jgi:hypothetical protein